QDDYARVNSDLYGNLTEATFAWYVKTGNNSTDLVLLGLDTWVNDAVRGFFLAYTESAPNLQMGTSTQENSFHIFNGGNNNQDIAKNLSYDLETNTYYYIVAVFNGNEGKYSLYVDGNFIGSVSDPSWGLIAEANPHYAEIGAQRRSNLYTEQKLDEFRVWNRALTPWEAQAHLDVDYASNTSGLIGHWDFDEGQGGIAHDLTSNANHITLFNGTDWTLDTPQQGDLPEFFSPVSPTGLPYHVVVSDLQINNTVVKLGTEVGLFDGDVCVGAGIYDNTAPGTFTGEYYSNPGKGSAPPFGDLIFTRQDSVINFSTNFVVENYGISTQDLQVKWNGSIHVPESGEYDFYIHHHDGIRFYIDGAILINKWYNTSDNSYATVILAQGFHSVELHYYMDNTSSPDAHLKWRKNGQGDYEYVIPVDPTPSVSVTAWEENTGPPALMGFTAGNAITARVRSQVYGTWQMLEPAIQVVVGDGNFGTGSYGVVTLAASTAEFPVASVSPSSIDFGDHILNSTTSQSVTVANTGDAPLTISLVTPSDNQYAVAGDARATVAAGASADFTLNYTPTQESPANAVLSIYSDDPQNPVTTVELIGQGLPIPVATISVPAGLDFGAVTLGQSQELLLSVFNTGSADLTVSSLSVSGDAFAVGDTTAFSIDPGSEANITVAFAPSESGLVSGQVTISSDANNEPQITAALSGYGYEDHFNSVAPTGVPYTIVVDSITVDEAPLSIGDQVAVFEFDENTLTNKAVGSAIYTGGSASPAGGGSALSFDNGGYVRIESSDEWAFGSGDFAIEFWYYATKWDNNDEGFFAIGSMHGHDFWLSNSRVSPHNDLDLAFGSGQEFNSGWVPSLNTWYHLAIVRSGIESG
ncbi:MAG: choice-of-anchor D domain-containing protein, partial [Candidatus Neomarinimicrobiota bacterium]|nr:choice-of-anchor D domain-containing protein [Candidatus Neomarinimicrobiota bacterium]